MDRQLAREDILRAKSVIYFNKEIIYVVPEDGNTAYGISRNSHGWFEKKSFWEYYDSELMLSYMEMIPAEKALEMVEEWERAAQGGNTRLDRAICYAVEHHAGQKRKGTDRPYITHPLEVMNILMRMNADLDLQIAGVLHDTVEDTDAALEEITELFGEDVGGLVAHHSENKTLSWLERKSHAISSLQTADKRLKMLVMADKLSNLRSMEADFKELGDGLWERFNAPVEKQSWYYSEIQDALWDMQLDDNTEAAYWEMVGRYKDVFVKFYRSNPCTDSSEEYLLQAAAHGEVHRLDRGNPQWYEVDPGELNDAEFHEVSRKEVEETEDRWNEPFWERIEEDLHVPEITVLSGRNRHAWIRIRDGELTLCGEDYGPACERINGKQEYEYYVSFDEDNTKRLLAQMRIDHGIEWPLEELFKMVLGTEMPSTGLMEYCEAKAVEYRFHSF